MPTHSLIAVVLAFAGSYLLTRAMLACSRKFQLMDFPNDRSSHLKPTPRGGGIAIVVSSLAAIAAGWATGIIAPALGFSFLAGGFLVAAVGFWDDLRSVNPGFRLVGQLAAACLLVQAIGAPSSLHVFSLQIGSPYVAGITILFVVWLINLSNFMDGIDGLAASECVLVMLVRGSMLYASGDYDLFYASLVFAAAAAGFLLLNWSPARIFMGDVGSGYIGVAYGALLLADIVRYPGSLWVWLILLAAFITDATLTLFRRTVAGKRVWEAHRSHAYQHASRRWGHARTTAAYLAVNIFWLAPIARCANRWPESGSLLFVAAVCPLALAAWYFRAGTEQLPNSVERFRNVTVLT
jgi:Fuc2NAc and GlcNAc transferase